MKTSRRREKSKKQSESRHGASAAQLTQAAPVFEHRRLQEPCTFHEVESQASGSIHSRPAAPPGRNPEKCDHPAPRMACGGRKAVNQPAVVLRRILTSRPGPARQNWEAGRVKLPKASRGAFLFTVLGDALVQGLNAAMLMLAHRERARGARRKGQGGA